MRRRRALRLWPALSLGSRAWRAAVPARCSMEMCRLHHVNPILHINLVNMFTSPSYCSTITIITTTTSTTTQTDFLTAVQDVDQLGATGQGAKCHHLPGQTLGQPCTHCTRSGRASPQGTLCSACLGLAAVCWHADELAARPHNMYIGSATEYMVMHTPASCLSAN